MKNTNSNIRKYLCSQTVISLYENMTINHSFKEEDPSLRVLAEGAVPGLAEGGVSRLAEGTVSRPEEGGVSRLAEGTVSRLAEGGVSRLAEGAVPRRSDQTSGIEYISR